MRHHKKTLSKIIEDLKQVPIGKPFIERISQIFYSSPNDLETQSKILYALISLFLIDEITLQPTRRVNFIDMASYYYRSESYSMIFPQRYHSKYNIIEDHIKRKNSLFFSNKNFIENYIKIKANSYEKLGNIYSVHGQKVDYKIPISRQEYLIEFFKESPEEFYSYFKSNLSIEDCCSKIVRYRLKIGYDKFLLECIEEGGRENYYREMLSYLLGEDEEFLLTSSGTAANILATQIVNTSKSKKFIHKYWYYENLKDNEKTLYLKDISGIEENFDIFLLCSEPSNFIDTKSPQIFESFKDSTEALLRKLGNKPDKNFTVIIDITSTPDFKYINLPHNVTMIKTLSLSKYQEGLNTNFAGMVIFPSNLKDRFLSLSEQKGLGISKYDSMFLFIPEIRKYLTKIKKVRELTSSLTLSYKDWKTIPVGLSFIIVPNNKIINQLKNRFLKQKAYTDREFSWVLRDKINDYIKTFELKDIYFGDSFMFPDSRINIQGPKVKRKDGSSFKLRFPRISPGYKTNKEEIKKYKDFCHFLIDLYISEYSKL